MDRVDWWWLLIGANIALVAVAIAMAIDRTQHQTDTSTCPRPVSMAFMTAAG